MFINQGSDTTVGWVGTILLTNQKFPWIGTVSAHLAMTQPR